MPNVLLNHHIFVNLDSTLGNRVYNINPEVNHESIREKRSVVDYIPGNITYSQHTNTVHNVGN